METHLPGHAARSRVANPAVTTAGCVFAAASPMIDGNQIRIYYGGSDAQHYDIRNGHLCMAKPRLGPLGGIPPQQRVQANRFDRFSASAL